MDEHKDKGEQEEDMIVGLLIPANLSRYVPFGM